MADPTKRQLRFWQIATAVFATSSIVLGGMRATHKPDDANALADHAEGELAAEPQQSSSPAAVVLNDVAGPDALKAAFQKALDAKMAEGALTYSSPGVTTVHVDADVLDETTTAEGDDINVKVRAKLLLIAQPSNALRGSLSASASVSLGAAATPDAQNAMKTSAAEAVANSLYGDLTRFVASP